jgi:hypothetical protein
MTETDAAPPPHALVSFGWIVFFGSLGLIFIALNMQTTVEVPSVGAYGGGEVVNQELLQEQLIRAMLGGFGCVAGMAMATAGKVSEMIDAVRASAPKAAPPLSAAPSPPSQPTLSPSDY